MPTIIAYDCKCGEKLSVYMPKTRMIFDPKKKYIEAAEEWDEGDIASGSIKAAEQAAIDAGTTFVHAGTIEAYQCKCGKVISLMDFLHRWLKNIVDKYGKKHRLKTKRIKPTK